MKKLGLLFKESSEKLIKDSLKDSENLFIVNYSKVSSPDLSNLRQVLRNTNARLFMVKNSVARRALNDMGQDAVKTIEGPCGLVFVKNDPVETCKILFNFLRDHEQFKVESGYLKDRVLGKKDIEVLAKLPPKEMLRAELVAVINSPLSRLTNVLKQNLNTLTYYLEQRKDKVNQGGE